MTTSSPERSGLSIADPNHFPSFSAVKLSEPRTLYLARESLVRLRDEKLAEIPNFQVALRKARELIVGWGEKGDEVDELVRKKIASLKRGVVEGGAEWNILYRRYREEELRRKGRLR